MQRRSPISADAPPSAPEPYLALLADEARFSLRIDPRHLASACEIFGLALPQKIGALVCLEDRRALCLGPDEWSLLAPLGEQARIEQGFARLYPKLAHSLVDIGHREIAIAIEGSKAAFLLQAAIAFDVETMPIMSGCRTLIARSQILLLRESAQRFRIEVWNSFAGYVWLLLHRIRHEIALGL